MFTIKNCHENGYYAVSTKSFTLSHSRQITHPLDWTGKMPIITTAENESMVVENVAFIENELGKTIDRVIPSEDAVVEYRSRPIAPCQTM